MSIRLVAAEKDCYVDLNVVAIGGGARGSGSGHVETATVRMNVNSPVAEILVGQMAEPSKVEIGGELVLEASPGRGPSRGAGYSGGGYHGEAGGSGGGSDGGDIAYDSSHPGGESSDLGLVSMKNFILTPAADGGASGGVRVGSVVDGKVPGNRTLWEYKGVGFGSGGSSCVLIEI